MIDKRQSINSLSMYMYIHFVKNKKNHNISVEHFILMVYIKQTIQQADLLTSFKISCQLHISNLFLDYNRFYPGIS